MFRMKILKKKKIKYLLKNKNNPYTLGLGRLTTWKVITKSKHITMDALKGKSEEIFFGWLDSSESLGIMYFRALPRNLKNALIIEFFDSVGIIALVDIAVYNDEPIVFDWEVRQQGISTVYSSYDMTMKKSDFKTRSEATESAITKAVEIFNSRSN